MKQEKMSRKNAPPCSMIMFLIYFKFCVTALWNLFQFSFLWSRRIQQRFLKISIFAQFTNSLVLCDHYVIDRSTQHSVLTYRWIQIDFPDRFLGFASFLRRWEEFHVFNHSPNQCTYNNNWKLHSKILKPIRICLGVGDLLMRVIF